MDIRETINELDKAALVALAIGVAVIGLTLLVVMIFIFAANLGTFVLDTGEEIEDNVQASVSVSSDAEANEMTVTFTSNQNADYLRVEWGTSGETVEVTGSSGDASVDDERTRLSTAGSAVTLSDGDSGTETAVRVTVTAVGEDEETVIVTREVTT